MINHGVALLFVSVSYVLGSPCSAAALAGRLTGSVVAGFDSYTENYTVVQNSTFTQLNEFRTRINLGYLRGTFLKDYIQIQAQSLIGQESFEASGRMSVMRRFGTSRVALDNALTVRSYHESSTYAFANDLRRYDLRLYAQREFYGDISLRLSERLEVVDFENRTEFDQDYVRNGIELGARLDRGISSSYSAALGFANKSVPDTTEIAYKAYLGHVEYRHTFGLHKQVFITLNGERRIYAHKPARSPFWSVYANAIIQPFTVGDFGFKFDNTLESYTYDRDSNVFFGYTENRSALQASYFRSTHLSIGLGPTYGFLTSSASRSDEYAEIGGKLSVDYHSGPRVWLSGSYERGWRNYTVDERLPSVVFSDFSYHRISLFTTVRLWRNTNVNVFANIEPEDHKVPADDSTTTLFSTDISYSF